MFNADLTWDGGPTERVGQRRERKVKEKVGSIKSVDQARPSSARRWLNRKKPSLDISVTPIPASLSTSARPVTDVSSVVPTSPAPRYSCEVGLQDWSPSRRRGAPPPDPQKIKDPEEQPDYILSGYFSPQKSGPEYHRQLHSSLDKDQSLLPSWTALASSDAVGDGSWAPTAARYEKRRQSFQADVRAVHGRKASTSSESGIALTREVSVTTHDRGPDLICELPAFSTSPPARNSSMRVGKKRFGSVRKVKSSFFQEQKPPTPGESPQRLPGEAGSPLEKPLPLPPIDTLRLNPRDWTSPPATPPSSSQSHSFWQPPPDLERCATIKPSSKGSGPSDSVIGVPTAGDSQSCSPRLGLSHFQRFVRRMENAGPKIVLDRLTENWDESSDKATRDEVELEKHLWTLTALQLRSLEKFANSGQNIDMLPSLDSAPTRRRILELGGNLAELYQLSAIYPKAHIHHLTVPWRSPDSTSVALPSQITHTLTVSVPGQQPGSLAGAPLSPLSTPDLPLLPLPYAACTLNHIRSSALPALLPASQIPDLLQECHRVLAPSGIMQLRIVEPLPERQSTGPKMRQWIEDCVTLPLESHFRTSRPGTLVGGWLRAAGFTVVPAPSKSEGKTQALQRCLRLPAVVSSDLDSRVASFSTTDASAVPGWSLPPVEGVSGTDSWGWFGPSPKRDRWTGEADVDEQVGSLVLRSLWKDVWGGFLDMGEGAGGKKRWWWEDAELVKECLEFGTAWQVGTLVAVKGSSSSA